MIESDILLTETWPSANIASAELFPALMSDRESGRGGDVLVAQRTSFRSVTKYGFTCGLR